MSYFKDKPLISTRTTSHVHRPYGGVADVREIIDRAAHVKVLVFPMSLASKLVPSELACPAFYAMTGDAADGSVPIYLGEPNCFSRRLGEHLADPQKAWARLMVVVRGTSKEVRFTKETAAYLQFWLTHAADRCGVMKVVAGCPPRMPEIDPLEMPLHERMLEDAKRLLFDAGVTAFEPAPGGMPQVDAPALSAETADDAESGPMEIDVHLPPGGAEFELRYDETIWARGYPANDRFVVAAGSDFRIATNPSASPVTRARRAALFEAGVLTPIPGAVDRMRITVDIAFPSMATAAKSVCGAHVDSSKWRPVDPTQRPVMQL